MQEMQETRVQSLGREDLEEGTATHSSILAWRIPWTEEPGGLQLMGLQRVGHDWATEHTLFKETLPGRLSEKAHPLSSTSPCLTARVCSHEGFLAVRQAHESRWEPSAYRIIPFGVMPTPP